MNVRLGRISVQDQIKNAAPAEDGPLTTGAVLFTVLLCVLFGANAVAIKISLTGLGVFTSAAIRFSLAALTILIWALLTGKALRLSYAQFRLLTVLAVIFYVQLSLFYIGLSKTTASHGTLIANVLPFVVLVLAHFFIKGDRISAGRIIGLTLGFSGVLVLLGDTAELSREALWGDLIVLSSVLIWGGNAVYTKRIITWFEPSQVTLYPVAMAAPLFLLSALFWDQPMVRQVDVPIVSAMMYQSFVTASFGLLGWTTLIKRYGATTLHSYIFIMPLSGVFFGIVLLDEPLTIRLIGAIVLVTAGLVVVNKKGNRRLVQAKL